MGELMRWQGLFVGLLSHILRPGIYLELGLEVCDTINRVIPHCGRAIGVDINDVECDGRFEFHRCSTDEYFDSIRESDICFDLTFIDADHTYEQVLKDFDEVFLRTKTNGIIILHDTYPTDLAYTASGLCRTAYRMIERLQCNYSECCEWVTIPIFPGLTIVRKGTNADFRDLCINDLAGRVGVSI